MQLSWCSPIKPSTVWDSVTWWIVFPQDNLPAPSDPPRQSSFGLPHWRKPGKHQLEAGLSWLWHQSFEINSCLSCIWSPFCSPLRGCWRQCSSEMHLIATLLLQPPHFSLPFYYEMLCYLGFGTWYIFVFTFTVIVLMDCFFVIAWFFFNICSASRIALMRWYIHSWNKEFCLKFHCVTCDGIKEQWCQWRGRLPSSAPDGIPPWSTCQVLSCMIR